MNRFFRLNQYLNNFFGGASISHAKELSTPSRETYVLPVNDPALFFSPYNWRITSDCAETTNPGSYLKARFTGTSVALQLDTRSFSEATVSANLYPTLGFSIDNGPWSSVRLTPGMTELTLASNLPPPPNEHSLFVYYRFNMDTVDLWEGPINTVRITGLLLDAAGTLLPEDLRPGRLLVYGDSMAQAAYDDFASYHDIDSRFTYAFALAFALDAELGVIGNARQGWKEAGQGGVPPFYTPGNPAASSWDKYTARASRLTEGRLTPEPERILVALGRNDPAVDPGRVVSFLKELRAAAPGASLFLVVPFAGTNRDAITEAFDLYQKSVIDRATHLIDLKTDGLFLSPGTATAYSGDKTHPNVNTQGLLAAKLAVMMTSTEA